MLSELFICISMTQLIVSLDIEFSMKSNCLLATQVKTVVLWFRGKKTLLVFTCSGSSSHTQILPYTIRPLLITAAFIWWNIILFFTCIFIQYFCATSKSIKYVNIWNLRMSHNWPPDQTLDIPGLSFTIYLSIISICTQCSYMQQSKGVYYKEIAWIHAMKN